MSGVEPIKIMTAEMTPSGESRGRTSEVVLTRAEQGGTARHEAASPHCIAVVAMVQVQLLRAAGREETRAVSINVSAAAETVRLTSDWFSGVPMRPRVRRGRR
jgi:hypothetical protein